jgi:hypothetical protein
MSTLLLFAGLLLMQGTPAKSAQPSFDAWWPQFQKAVATNDAKTVAAGVQFPLQWENGPIRDVKSAAEFEQKFAALFTPEIKKMIATQKPKWLGREYAITWKARGNEYSLYFKPNGERFVFNGLSEGPP